MLEEEDFAREPEEVARDMVGRVVYTQLDGEFTGYELWETWAFEGEPENNVFPSEPGEVDLYNVFGRPQLAVAVGDFQTEGLVVFRSGVERNPDRDYREPSIGPLNLSSDLNIWEQNEGSNTVREAPESERIYSQDMDASIWLEGQPYSDEMVVRLEPHEADSDPPENLNASYRFDPGSVF